jgi:hypothetical protein
MAQAFLGLLDKVRSPCSFVLTLTAAILKIILTPVKIRKTLFRTIAIDVQIIG